MSETFIRDPCSLSNVQEIRCSHFHLNLKADFESKSLKGNVKHDMKFVVSKPKTMILDTRDLVISGVHISGAKDIFEETSFHLNENKKGPLGIPLEIDLESMYDKGILSGNVGESFQVIVCYETTPDSVGIQWLSPSQTDGKTYPYLFTQFQAIHCRTAVPCQDSPSNKVTYSADICVPEGLTALMSAISTKHEIEDSGDITEKFSFKQVYSFYFLFF